MRRPVAVPSHNQFTTAPKREKILSCMKRKLLSALTRCLQEEAAAIAIAADRLSGEQVESALGLLERCSDCKAKLVITGVGKSGIVARKIAATFSSIGLMALSQSPRRSPWGPGSCRSRRCLPAALQQRRNFRIAGGAPPSETSRHQTHCLSGQGRVVPRPRQ